MMHRSEGMIYSILLLQLFLAVSSRTATVSVCSSNPNSEPSISPIFKSFISADVSDIVIERLSTFKVFRNYVPNYVYIAANAAFDRVYQMTLPFERLISDGIFHVDMTTDHFFFRDVLLIQKNGFLTNTVCSILPMRYRYIRSLLCECLIGRNLSRKDIDYISSTSTDFNQDYSHQWCVRNPCTNKSSRDGVCVIAVDPFHTACILIQQLSTPSHLLLNNNEEIIHDHVVITPFSTDLIKFHLSTPFMSKKMYGINKMLAMFYDDKDNKTTESLEDRQIPIFLSIFKNKLDDIAAVTPIYLFDFIVGSTILLFSEDLASSPIVQSIISTLFGTVLFCLWLAMAILM
jgi:hypothetical protein